MSVKLMSMVWERMGTSSTETLLALAIADYANDLGEGIYPALSTLARKSRQSESTTRRQIKSFLQAGWLIRVNAGHGGRNVTNEYRINPEWIKGVRLEGFPELGADPLPEGSEQARDPSAEGSRPLENPSTAVTGYANENPSNLTPFQGGNPSNLKGFQAERVSNGPQKGVTAMTPDPLEPKNSDAHPPARRGARARETEPGPVTADAIRPSWSNLAMVTLTRRSAEALRRRELAQLRLSPVLADLPPRVQQLLRMAAPPLVERFVVAELQAGRRTRELEQQLDDAATEEAETIVGLYAQGLCEPAAQSNAA